MCISLFGCSKDMNKLGTWSMLATEAVTQKTVTDSSIIKELVIEREPQKLLVSMSENFLPSLCSKLAR